MRGARVIPSARVHQGNHTDSVMQVLHTDTDQEAPRPDASLTRASAGLGFPSRRGPLPAQRPPSHGKRTRLGQPTRKPSPTHTCQRVTPTAARPSDPARHPRRPVPVRGTSPRVPTRPRVKTTRRPPPRSTRSTPPPPPGPALAHAPPGPRPAALAHSRGLARPAPQLDRPVRTARSRGRPPPTRPPGSDSRCAGGGEEQQWPSVLTHRRAVPVPSARRSAVRRCAAMRAVPAPPLAVEAT